jgi:hypothetical protein
MATADFLDEKRSEIAARLKELKPLVDEYERLEAAAAALDGATPATPLMHAAPARRATRATARTRARRTGGAAGRRAAARAAPRRSRWSRRTPASRFPRSPRRWGSSRTTCTACCPASPTTASSSRTAAAGSSRKPHNDPRPPSTHIPRPTGDARRGHHPLLTRQRTAVVHALLRARPSAPADIGPKHSWTRLRHSGRVVLRLLVARGVTVMRHKRTGERDGRVTPDQPGATRGKVGSG